MCTDCSNCNKKIEKKLPENELWQLYRAAYKQYQSEILHGQFTYHRFVERFVSYHLPAFCLNEADARLHIMNVFELKDLLENRRDLVEAHFSNSSFEEKDYLQMNKEFNQSDFISSKKSAVLAHFNDEQISLITNFLNEAELLIDEVSEVEVKALFDCTLKKPLKPLVNRRIAKFFDSLRYEGFLPHAWQKLIADNKLVASSSTGKPLTAHMISSYLSDHKSGGEDTLNSQCKNLTQKLKESM